VTDSADRWLAEQGLESQAIFRVSRSVREGLLQTTREENATLILAEWRSDGGDPLDPNSAVSQLIAGTPLPILLAHGAVEPFERLLVVARRDDLFRPASLDLELAAELTRRLARGRHVLFVGTSTNRFTSLFVAKFQFDHVEHADPLAWAKNNASATDLLVFPGLDAAREALERFPSLAKSRFLVAIAAHSGALAHEERVGGLVVGRSMTEHPAA